MQIPGGMQLTCCHNAQLRMAIQSQGPSEEIDRHGGPDPPPPLQGVGVAPEPCHRRQEVPELQSPDLSALNRVYCDFVAASAPASPGRAGAGILPLPLPYSVSESRGHPTTLCSSMSAAATWMKPVEGFSWGKRWGSTWNVEVSVTPPNLSVLAIRALLFGRVFGCLLAVLTRGERRPSILFCLTPSLSTSAECPYCVAVATTPHCQVRGAPSPPRSFAHQNDQLDPSPFLSRLRSSGCGFD